MFIHFAFGELGRKGYIQEQTERVLKDIISPKRLKISKCKEFVPSFRPPGAKEIPFGPVTSVTKKSDGSAEVVIAVDGTKSLPDAPPVKYLALDVPMICFIKIAFNALKDSPHKNYYGKFGIVLSDAFLKSKGIKSVMYYTEANLANDELVKTWNHIQSTGQGKERLKDLQKEITLYRKPASLFPNFKRSIQLQIICKNGEVTAGYFTYNRYPDNYKFRLEQECRIAFSEGDEYLYFDEKDLFMIIVPNKEAMVSIDEYLCKNWSIKPKLVLFPE
ncbi:MAG: abortive infection system antitoxin AbiGi family protein [Candidatus Omnitrophota bacterium]|jgi:hypothetical protein